MVNSFLFVIHHIQRQIMKKSVSRLSQACLLKCVKAITGIMIKK